MHFCLPFYDNERPGLPVFFYEKDLPEYTFRQIWFCCALLADKESQELATAWNIFVQGKYLPQEKQ
jgi:hypothetical protein